MRFALVSGERQEAQKGLSGACPSCDQPMIAKCGQIKAKHWAHRGKCTGDSWWKPETDWHRNWKGQFPDDWQERIHTAESGERHIADVKTIKDWVIEFQHSHIHPEERQARNAFYKKLVWVVDGMNRKTDKPKFFASLKEVATMTNLQSPVRRIFTHLKNDCALFRDWSGSPTPVFFDFGNEEPMLWCLLPQNPDGEAYILEFFRVGFIAFHRNEVIGMDYFSDLIRNFRNTHRRIKFTSSNPNPEPISSATSV